MKLLTILFTVCSVIIPATAGFAAIDPLPEGIGVYFDTEASALCQAPGGEVTCYLMLTNASGPFVLACVCAVDIDTNLPAGAFDEEWWIHGGFNYGGPEDPVTMVSRFILSPESMPSPTNGYFILASRRISTLHPDDFVSFRVFPIPDFNPSCPLCYVGLLGLEIPLHVVNGNTDVPQTFITSGDCVVANEDITWSQLKALY